MKEQHKKKGFARRVTVAILTVTLPLLLMTTLYFYQRTENEAFKRASQRSSAVLKRVAERLHSEMEGFETTAKVLAEIYAHQPDSLLLNEVFATPLQPPTALQSIMTYAPNLSQDGCYEMSDSGLIVSKLTDKIGSALLDDCLLRTSEPFIRTIPQQKALTPTFEIQYWHSITGEDEVRRWVGLRFTLDDIVHTINELSTDDGTFFALTEDGTLLTAFGDFYPAGMPLFELASDTKDNPLRNLIKLMMNGETEVMRKLEVADNQLLYVSFTPVSDAHFTLGMFVPEATIFQETRAINRTVFLLLLLEILLAIAVVNFLIIKRLRYISDLSTTIHQTERGVFGAMLPAISSNDEFSQLNDDFRQMQERLSSYFSQQISNVRVEEQNMLQIKQRQYFRELFLPADERQFVFGEIGTCALKIEHHSSKVNGSDFYDYFFLNEHQFCIILGRIVGGGSEKSLQMAHVMSMIREQMGENKSLARFAEQLNEQILVGNHAPSHVKLLLAVIDSGKRSMNFVNIGFELLYLIRNQVVINIESMHGEALGLVSGAKFTSSTLGLQVGDRLFFADSVVANLLNKSGVNYSKERLEQLLTAHRQDNPVQLLHHLSTDIERHIKGVENFGDYSMVGFFFSDEG